MRSNPFDDIWDEHKWESHINQIEQKSHQFREYLDTTFGDENPRWYKILKESSSEHDAINSFIEEELIFDEAYFPDDEDDWDLEDDVDDEDFFGLMEDSFDDDEDWEYDDDDLLDEDFDDIEEGDEWKLLSDDYVMSDYGSIENLAVYGAAHSLGAEVLKIAEENDQVHTNPSYNLFVSDVLLITAKIAAGYSLGFEQDVLGGNIAYNKKALYAANRALDTLRTLKNKMIFKQSDDYYRLHATLFELRNDLGVYIQELREQFYNT